MINEFELIEKISKIIDKNQKYLGDDCAFFGKNTLATTDTMVENVHFLRSFDPFLLGQKLVSINVSDIASSGGLPSFGLVGLCLPPNLQESWVLDLYRGIKKASKKYSFKIVGGNVSKASEISISLSLVGKTKRLVSRAGARVGDSVFVSGKTGLSRLGLEFLLKNKSPNPFKLNHLNPKARLDLAKFLSSNATSAVDISDGLAQDLSHIARASKVSIDITDLKPHKSLIKILGKKTALDYALNGGEDYEIGFCLDKTCEKKALALGCIKIGKVVKKQKADILLNGLEFAYLGFEHFAIKT